MDQMAPKAKQWINEKKDPRSARWQAGLEAVMDLFSPDLNTGKLTPVHPLEAQDLPVFKAALKTLDLSPNILAAFLPPRVANSIVPPDSAEELVRIQQGKSSYKIIILRPDNQNRILCVEISAHAHRPGIDIFQSGALLGSFNYPDHETCLGELTKAVRAHAWEKDKWQQKDHVAYTLNWFEKTEYLATADVSVDTTLSFFHSPTLIKTNRVDALFQLIYQVLHHRFQDTEWLHKSLAQQGVNMQDKNRARSTCDTLSEAFVLDKLNFIKALELIEFTGFTPAENQGFKTEFTRTTEKLSADLYAIRSIFQP